MLASMIYLWATISDDDITPYKWFVVTCNDLSRAPIPLIGIVQALSMAGFRVAFAKDVHCIPLGFGSTVFRNLHALLCSFQVSSYIVQNLSYRSSVHAIPISHSIYPSVGI
jgi:hypothetical protein